MSGRYPEIVYTDPYRDRVEQGLRPFEVDSAWPWQEALLSKPS